MERKPLHPGPLQYSGPTEATPSQRVPAPKWWRLSRRVSNAGATARNHLANERTFLAWLRTAVSIVALGLALAKFAPDDDGIAGGATMIALGGSLLWYSGYRYFEVERGLEDDAFDINIGGVVCVLVGATLLLLCCAALLIRAGMNR